MILDPSFVVYRFCLGMLFRSRTEAVVRGWCVWEGNRSRRSDAGKVRTWGGLTLKRRSDLQGKAHTYEKSNSVSADLTQEGKKQRSILLQIPNSSAE